MIDLGTCRELFVDPLLVDTLNGLERRLQTPVPAGPAFTFDAPWEGRFAAYSSVIRDGDRLLLYYRGWPNPKTDKSVYCLAESLDGRTFQRVPIGDPVDGLVRNIIPIGDHADAFAPFLDTRPGCPPAERFKAIANDKIGKAPCLRTLISPDGIHWQRLGDEPAMTRGAFDSLNVAFWSVAESCYVCYFRTWTRGTPEQVHAGDRTISRATSPDFRTWSDPVEMFYGDTPREELYTNNTFPYFRAPHIYLALPKRFLRSRQTHTAAEAAALDILPPCHTGVSDGVFMTTRGNNQYDRSFMEAFIRPGRDPLNWVCRSIMSTHGLVQTAPDELSLYYHIRYSARSQHLERYTLRLDGFAALHAPYVGGTMTSKPFTFTGNRLELNYATSAPGTIRVELQTPDGTPIPGHRLADCDPIWGDRLDHPVTWHGVAALSPLRGLPIRLHLQMHDADIYSLQFPA